MGDKTGIGWTNATWNPIRGCSRVSDGCRNCYAERVAARFSGKGQPYEGLIKVGTKRQFEMVGGEPTGDFRTVKSAKWSGDVRMVPEHLADPLRWKRPRRIFVNSMSDLFHEKLTNEQIAAVFGVMAACPQHTFQVLTKRPKRMREWFAWINAQAWAKARWVEEVADAEMACGELRGARGAHESTAERVAVIRYASEALGGKRLPYFIMQPWPLPNVWLGVSVENQDAADERIPELRRIRAAVRFLSCEPLLGPLNLDGAWGGWNANNAADALDQGIDWIIDGCESGPGARPADDKWYYDIAAQCRQAGVPYFHKQMMVGSKLVHDLADFPVGLRSQEFPR